MYQRAVATSRLALVGDEICTLAEAKAQLRVTHNAEDALISALIPAAREACENFTRRSFIRQTFRAHFSCEASAQNPQGMTFSGNNARVFGSLYQLPYPEFAEVVSLFFKDESGNDIEASASSYSAGPNGGGAVVQINAIPGNASLIPVNPVVIKYEAGPDVPSATMKQAVMLMLSNLFENRTPTAPSSFSEIPFTLRAILTPLTVPNI